MENQGRINNFSHRIIDKVNEAITALDASVPWFDVYIFMKYILKSLCIYFVAETSLTVLACIVMYRVVTDMEAPSKSRNWNSADKRHTSSPSNSDYTITLSMVYEFAFQFLMQYGALLLIYCISYIGVSLLTFVLACYASVLDAPKSLNDKLTLEHIDEKKLKELLQRLGTQVPQWLKTPDHERVEWLNKILKQLWPQIGVYFEDLIKYKVLPELNFLMDKSIISGDIPPRVSSVKVREAHEKLLLDVNILYDGDFSASFEVKKGFELEIEQIKLDGEITIELKNFVGHFPFVRSVVFHMEKHPKVNVKFKRLGSIIEKSKLAKRACLDYIQKQIKEAFPRHHNLQIEEEIFIAEEVSRPQVEPEKVRFRHSFHSDYTSYPTLPTDEAITFARELSASLRSQSSVALSNPSESESHSTRPQSETIRDKVSDCDEKTSINPNFDEPASEQSSQSISDTVSSSMTETKKDETTPGKWEGKLRETIARDVALSKKSMQEMEILTLGDNLSVLSEEFVEPYTLVSREGLPGSLESDGGHGCIELTTIYKAPTTLLVIVHKVRNLPHKGGRMPNPYVKLHLLSTGLKELKEESTEVLERTDNPDFETTFAFPLTKPLSEYSLRVCTKTKHKRPHYLGQVVLCFAPFRSSKKVKERAWYDLADPKKDYVTCFVGYKDSVKGITFKSDRIDSFDGVPSSGSESDEEMV